MGRALVNTVMNLRVPYKAGEFLTSWEPVRFSRRTCSMEQGRAGCLSTPLWRHNDGAEPAMCCRGGRWFHSISVSFYELLECPRKSLRKIEASKTQRPSLLRDRVPRHWVFLTPRFESLLISYLRVKCHWTFDSWRCPTFRESILIPSSRVECPVTFDLWLRPLRCLETSSLCSLGDSAPHLERTKFLTVTLWKPKIWTF